MDESDRATPARALDAPAGAATAAAATRWRGALAALALVLAAIGVFHFDTFAAMVSIWSRSESFAHAFAVPPIALWLIWRQRAALALHTPRPSPWMLLPFGLASLGWLGGQMVAANAVTQLAATALLVLAVPLVLGWRVAMVVLFPLTYLFFAVPIGEFMIPPLMQGTADVTVAALRLSGIPVYREGLQFVIPSGHWSVVEACSGVRYLMASFMVGTLFAYLNYRSWRRRLVFAIVSLLVPIVANWARAYMIVMLGHLSGNALATGADHLVYGWVFFGVVITLLFMIGARWAEAPAAPAAPATSAADAGRAATAFAPAGWAVAALAAALAGLPHGVLQRLDAAESKQAPSLALPGALGGGWRADAGAPPWWTPAYVAPAAKASARFVDGTGRAVDLHVYYYRGQGGERKLISSNNTLVASKDPQWNLVASQTRAVPGDGGLAVRESMLLGQAQDGGGARVQLRVWQLYRVGDAWTTSDVRAKLLTARQRLQGRGDDGAAVFLAAQDDGTGRAEAVLAAFLADNRGRLEALLAAPAATPAGTAAGH